MDYRPVPDTHEDALDAALVYAFSPERGPDYTPEGPDRPDSFHPRAMYDAPAERRDDPSADDLTVVCGYYDFSMQIRGEVHEAGGVSAVASPPEYRREGLVRDLLTAVHREFRDDGVAFATLWPFEFPFYRRLGYARVNDYSRTTVAPDALSSACPPAEGTYERLDPDDWARADDVYAAWGPADLRLDRSEEWWRTRVFQSWQTDPYVYGWTAGDAGDDLGGYLVYTVEDGDDGKTLAVSEFAYRDREARGHLLRFCRNHDSQVERVRIPSTADERLFDDLDDPRAAETEVRPGPMVRLVDVAAALESISYPVDVEAEVVLDVRDDTCPWNDQPFRLRVAGGRGTVSAVETDAAGVTLGVGALSRLVVGSHGSDRLVEIGEVEVDDETRSDLAAAFPRTEPFLREGF
ncbi:GNAT family N-acetyltransferase [Halobaculum marinum]|uniref:Enhanced intracellular survival protein Eis n=1 Tax=Halobaculum marinum TaxID=3031996 RepID=A0ABD5X1M3_9EURY|nr:GNAT family N-acetyltransferase [Halobaculum sp. DT55]